MTVERALTRGLEGLGLGAVRGLDARLIAYLELLGRWNRVYNLTAVQDPLEQVTRHLLDSLALLPHLPPGGEVLDVGSGAGLPGIPLALAAPGRRFRLLDSSLKKTRFLTQVVAELGIGNAIVTRARVESFHPAPPPAVIVARAFAPLDRMLASIAHLCNPGVAVLAMKGPGAEREAERLPNGFALVAVHVLRVPGLAQERRLLHVARA